MSLASRAGDLYYAFRFIKLLTTKWEDSDAYKLGIIDNDGKRIKSKKISTSEEKSAYTPFIRLAYNIKRLLEKLPGGGSTLSSYAAALYLLKEKYELTDRSLNKILDMSGIDPLDLMVENSQWFLLDDGQLSPGVYRVKNPKAIITTLDECVKEKDQIRVADNAYPIGDLMGISIYEANHIETGQPIYITIGEIYK